MEATPGSSAVGERKGEGFGFSGATLAVVALASTLAQFLALASLGHLDDVEPQVSTGGLLALLAAIVMGLKCPSWSYWKKWIWVWVGIVTVLAFVTTNVNVQAWEEEARIADERAIQEAIAEMQAAQVCAQLSNEIQAKQSALNLDQNTTNEGGWREFLREHDRTGQSALQQLKDDYTRTC